MKLVILEMVEQGSLCGLSYALTDVLNKVKPDYNYCVKTLTAAKYDDKVADIMASTMKDERRWYETSAHNIRATSQLLRPNCQPKEWLHLALKTELTCEQWNDIEVLMAKLTEVEYRGKLSLDLHHSQSHMKPADSVIMNLRGAK